MNSSRSYFEWNKELERHGTVAHIMHRIYEVQLAMLKLLDEVDVVPEELATQFGRLVDLYESEPYVSLEEEEEGLNRAFSAILPYVPLYVYTGECESLDEALADNGHIFLSDCADKSAIEVYAGYDFCDADYTEIRLGELIRIMQRLALPVALHHLCPPCGTLPRYYFELDEQTAIAILNGDLTAHPLFSCIDDFCKSPVEKSIKSNI